MTDQLLIRNGRILDPCRGIDTVQDLAIRDGMFVAASDLDLDAAAVLDAAGQWVAPGFWDIHVHLREPGGEAQETIESGSRSAAHGGFTHVVAMPNTVPPIDAAPIVQEVLRKGVSAGHCEVMTSGCMTRDRAGSVVVDLRELAAAGVVAFTDDGCTVMSDTVMREVMDLAAQLGIPVMDHAQDSIQESNGVMHQGRMSETFGLPGIPSEAEASIVDRDIRLAQAAGCQLHIQHVTSREAVDLIRAARQRGLPVTGEASPHHLALADEDIDPADARYKMNPPLRSAADRTALRDAVVDNTLSVLATDHAPHTREAKAKGFLQAPFGVVGLETAIGVTHSILVETGRMTPLQWIERWTSAPASVIHRPLPSLEIGQSADLVVLDVHTAWTVDPAKFVSKSSNSPFDGWELMGRPMLTVFKGRPTYLAPDASWDQRPPSG